MGVVEVVVVLALVLAFFASVGYLFRAASASSTERRPALPSVYSPEAYAARPEYLPGYCPVCGTENDPEYRYCRECISDLSAPF